MRKIAGFINGLHWTSASVVMAAAGTPRLRVGFFTAARLGVEHVIDEPDHSGPTQRWFAGHSTSGSPDPVILRVVEMVVSRRRRRHTSMSRGRTARGRWGDTSFGLSRSQSGREVEVVMVCCLVLDQVHMHMVSAVRGRRARGNLCRFLT